MRELKQVWRIEEIEDKKEEKSYHLQIFLWTFCFRLFRWLLRVLFREISKLILYYILKTKISSTPRPHVAFFIESIAACKTTINLFKLRQRCFLLWLFHMARFVCCLYIIQVILTRFDWLWQIIESQLSFYVQTPRKDLSFRSKTKSMAKSASNFYNFLQNSLS